MSDLEAKREARRQRILQASEDRMNRVLGKESNAPLNGPCSPEDNIRPPPPDICNSTGRIEANQLHNDIQTTDLRQRKAPTCANNDSQKTGQAVNQPVKSTVKISPLKKRHTIGEETTNIDESLNTSRSSSDAKMMLKHFEFLRIVLCFIVAFLCRKVLVHGYGVFYIQSVVIPFACLEAGFFTFKHKLLHNVMLPHRSSMLIAMLMLCGIKPNVVNIYNKVMGYLTAAGEDFAMFFFAFMMSNLFVS